MAQGGNFVTNIKGGRMVKPVGAGEGGTPVCDVKGGEYVWEVGSGEFVWYVGCFPKSELVHIDFDERVPIGALKAGDRINAWDTELKKASYTEITQIHKHRVMEIICFNNALRVSSSHPLMVMETEETGLLTPKWKISFEINVGDNIVGADGKLITIKSKRKHWNYPGIEVINLSTDCGVPYMVGNCIARPDNAMDNIMWADAPITQMLSVA